MAPSVFDKYRIILLASEGLSMGQIDVDLLLLNPASAAGTYATRMTLTVKK
jgi:hypothetical protein